jgi:class 3 adenylate cyclase
LDRQAWHQQAKVPMVKSQEEIEGQLRSLLQENENLREQIRRLQAGQGPQTALADRTGATLTASSATVAGVEEMILQVNPDWTIGYLNAPMAHFLQITDRRAVLGEPLAKIDRDPLGEGVLRTIMEAALSSGEQPEGSRSAVVERSCPGLDEGRLPPPNGPRPSATPVLRFVATAVKGRVEMVVQEITRLRWLENTFARYVAPEIIQQMLQRSEHDFMQMERCNLSVLFADLRGFTRVTQKLDPGVLQIMINDFLSNMVQCINRFGGTVDKFVGDEVMALFGAPLAAPDHALRALLAAVDMQRVHTSMLGGWAMAGRPLVGLGIGVTSGEVVVGNIGTGQRMEYTALGHSVNLAARLCASAAAGEVLTVQETFKQTAEGLKTTTLTNLPRFKFSPKGEKAFKNVDELVTVLSVSAV